MVSKKVGQPSKNSAARLLRTITRGSSSTVMTRHVLWRFLILHRRSAMGQSVHGQWTDRGVGGRLAGQATGGRFRLARKLEAVHTTAGVRATRCHRSKG